MIKASILADGSSDLTPLLRLLLRHPDVELIAVACPEKAGTLLTADMPRLTGDTDLRYTSDFDAAHTDALFIVGQPGLARTTLKNRDMPVDMRIIDMTGDYRMADDTHDFVNGIAELNRKPLVRGARHVSIPDHRTLAVALGLLPLAKNLLINSTVDVTIVSSDAASERGRMTVGPVTSEIATELTEALTTLQTSFASRIDGRIFNGGFEPGTMAVAELGCTVEVEHLRELYEQFYDDHNFVFIADTLPDIADVRGTNKCLIHLASSGNQLTITTVIDPDVKGRAGNAIHGMNLLFGLHERVGLT